MPTISEALSIAIAHQRAGRLDLAEGICRRILEAAPDRADALHFAGLIAHQQGRYEEAVKRIVCAIDVDGRQPGFHSNLGEAYRALGRLDEAVACYRRAIELNPALPQAYNNLGEAYRALGRNDQAVECFRQCLQIAPRLASGHNNLGNAVHAQGRFAEALACYRQALELEPDFAEAHNNLGTALYEQGEFDQAVAHCRRALELKPEYAEAHVHLGVSLEGQGNVQGAITCYRRAIELRPTLAAAHSNLVRALHLCPSQTPQSLHEEHRRWNNVHARPLARVAGGHENDRSLDRRLRIGYVSPDLRKHPVGRFALPLLEAHDHKRFEIFCYSSVRRADWITERCRARADVWRDVLPLSDEQAAQVVREDRIDILVDLTMHLEFNRLLLFAQNPAQLQVTYLAYCSTTGLDAIDYRLTDPRLDPPGHERFYSEESVPLRETYWCYWPIAGTPPVRPSPATEAGHITFGCLNSFCKVSEPTLAAWCRLLAEVPASRLILHSPRGSHRERVRALLAGEGVSPDRVSFLDFQPLADYFRAYGAIDVALDPFPFGGGTTTCDALWMGVPVVSLAGRTAVGRGGVSILSNVGLPELVARDVDDYVRIASELASDLPRLASLRAALRPRMQASPLMDSPRFARNVEAAYREMWRRWCDQSTAAAPAP